MHDVFSHQGLVYDQAEYQIVALMTHSGLATLRIAPSLMHTTSPAEWLLAPPIVLHGMHRIG